MVIVFGLFHGLIVLPIMLSLIGPKAYSHYDEKPKVFEDDAEKGGKSSSDVEKTVI